MCNCFVGAEESWGGANKGGTETEEGGGVSVQARAGAEGERDWISGERAQHYDPSANHGQPQTQDQEGQI